MPRSWTHRLPLAAVLLIVPVSLHAASGSPEVRLSFKPLDLTRPPSTVEIRSAGQLGGPLTPTREVADPQREARINLSFGHAIQAWNAHDYRRAVGLFRRHVEDFPDSPWAAEAELHLGCDAQYQGRYREARERYESILASQAGRTDADARMMVHKTRLRLGALDVLEYDFDAAAEQFRILKQDSPDWRHRTYAAHWLQRLSRHRGAEAELLSCGLQALAHLLELEGRPIEARAVRQTVPVSPSGQSLAQLVALATRHGVQLEARKIAPRELPALPLPAIAQLRSTTDGQLGHYWVIESYADGRFRIHDPQSTRTFEHNLEQFAVEWHGVVVVPVGSPDLPGRPLEPGELDDLRGGCCGAPAPESDLGSPEGNGDYTIPLLANGTYVVRASTAGYIDGQYPSVVVVVPDTETPGIDVIVTPDGDGDGDGWGDLQDNCPAIPNYDQADLDGDGAGDVCDGDLDGDDVANEVDNCPRDTNADQADFDLDGYGDVCTTSHCVASAAQLQTYLTAAQSDGVNDVLLLETGVFAVSQNGTTAFTYSSAEPYAIVLHGGYSPGCGDRGTDPAATVLDGEGVTRALTIGAAGAAGPLRHELDLLTIRNGSYSYAAGAQIRAGAGDVHLQDVIVEGNQTAGSRGGISIDTTTGSVRADRVRVTGNGAGVQAGMAVTTTSGDIELTDSVIAGNTATGDAGGLYLSTTDGTLVLLHDTVTGNAAGPTFNRGGGIYALVYGENGMARIHNNIVWGNSAGQDADLYVQTVPGAPPFELTHNDLGDFAIGGGQEPLATLNLDADPALADAASGDVHLTAASPCIDAGDATIAGLPAVDYEGDARVLGFSADIGADEFLVPGTSYGVGGFVREESTATPGVEMRLSGDATLSRWTNATGEYRFGWLDPGTYTVTPTDARYLFVPTERFVTVVDADVLGEDFEATLVDRDADGVYDTEDNCIDTPNPDQINNDTDPLGDACDCSPWNANEPPGPVGDTVLVDKGAAGEAIVSWTVPFNPQFFGTYRGTRAAGAAFTYNHTCLEKLSGWTPTLTDTDPVTAGALHYYLVGSIGCDASSLGRSTSGTERPNPTPCP